jgi:hypothetical protein
MTQTLEVRYPVALHVFYCNDCGKPYLTDNDGSRRVICDLCRCEGGMRGSTAIEE